MVSRIPSLLLVLVALGAFLCAVYLYLRPPIEQPGLVVEEPDRVYSDLIPGRAHAMDVPGHSSVSLSCILVVPKPGSFQASLPLYLDDGSLRELSLSVQGEAGSPPSGD